MARIRYLKPDFFIDPDLCELPYQHRLIFAGLWCYADKSGRLRYEPKKLKIQIVPYDNVKMEQILIDLSKKPFIQIYEVKGVKYIQIVNWEKHQNPHHTEQESEIPPYNGSLTVIQPLNNGSLKEKGKMDTISSSTNTSNTSNTSNLNNKDKYLSTVFLTKEEHAKLIERFGEDGTKQRIYDLNNGIMSKGYKYKSHYHTILSWERRHERIKQN